MSKIQSFLGNLKSDAVAGMVVFLIAIPLCLGIALASGAPLFSGLIGGMIGGILVGILSKSQTSISGPAAGLTSIVLSAIHELGTFEAFLVAVVIGGVIQIILGIARMGILNNYVPSAVIKGMLASIGVILIVKQIPHLIGYDAQKKVEFSLFNHFQGDVIGNIGETLGHLHPGAAIIGFLCLITMIAWERVPFLKKSIIPGPLAVIILGTTTNFFDDFFPALKLRGEHLVNVPVSKSISEFGSFFTFPDFSAIYNQEVWIIGLTIALVATLETLLNIEAVDKLDKKKRNTPTNRELMAQGVGNVVSGLIGGLPITSVVIRGSVGISSGAKTKMTTIVHGLLIVLMVGIFPIALNQIPLSTLAAVLIVTGFKLARPSMIRDIFKSGLNQFLPFMITLVAILALDLLVGVIIGLVIGLIYVLRNDIKSALQVTHEKQYNEDVARISLPQVASFINKAKMRQLLNDVPAGSKVIIDASYCKYIDHDIIEVIKNFKNVMVKDKGIGLSLVGFKDKYELQDEIQHAHVMTKELQNRLTPQDVVEILREGNQRFIKGSKIDKSITDQMNITSSEGQHPLAVILSCIDSRTTTELIFDLGMGDVFAVRVAGNVVNEDILASMEFACKIAGAKLIVVLGHSECGAIKGACDNVDLGNLGKLFAKIKPAIEAETATRQNRNADNPLFVKNVTRLNVHHNIFQIAENSEVLGEMINNGEVGIIGGTYDIKTGEVKFTPMYQANPIVA